MFMPVAINGLGAPAGAHPLNARVALVILNGQVDIALGSAWTPGSIRIYHALSCRRHDWPQRSLYKQPSSTASIQRMTSSAGLNVLGCNDDAPKLSTVFGAREK